MIAHVFFILFFFVLGACIGSFLNVVVWRLPRGESLSRPGSHCPKCSAPLRWNDNIPIFGWLLLRGRCRYCEETISPRYPIVELTCGLMFALYYVLYFIAQMGPTPPMRMAMINDMTGQVEILPTALILQQHWAIFLLDLFLLASLLAASLIDSDLFIIPLEIPWLAAAVGFITHALIDHPTAPGALSCSATTAALSIGGAIGLLLSIGLFSIGAIPQSFPQGEPLLEIDRAQLAAEMEAAAREGRLIEEAQSLPPPYSRGQIRLEIGKEMLFLLPPLALAAVALVMMHTSPPWSRLIDRLILHDWVAGLLGAIFGALIGAFVVWMTRILGTIGFGRVAMGLGDVHLMFGVGAIIGAAASTIAFFLAPFFGILIAAYMLITGKRRELPYGPYLSLATAFVMVFYRPIADYLSPGIDGLISILRARMGS